MEHPGRVRHVHLPHRDHFEHRDGVCQQLMVVRVMFGSFRRGRRPRRGRHGGVVRGKVINCDTRGLLAH